MSLADERLADGLLIQQTRTEIGSGEPTLLDQPNPPQLDDGQGIKPLQHLFGGKVPAFRLSELDGEWGALVIHVA